jgi:hypothetical protein
MRNAFDLSGRRLLITGAGGGIGAATARICASLGAEMILIDLDGGEAVAQSIRQAGGSAVAQIADVSRRADVERIADEIGAIDGLVLNAAINPWDDDWQAADWDESFERVMAVNVLGPIHAARAFMPGMITRRRGSIVLIGSLAGRMGGLIAGPHYVASKGSGQMARAPGRAAWRAGERRRSGLGRNADDAGAPGRFDPHSAWPQGGARGNRLADRVPLFGSGQLHLRSDPRRQWRRVHVVTGGPRGEACAGSAIEEPRLPLSSRSPKRRCPFVRDATVANETGRIRQSELPLALLGEGFRP